MGVHSVESHGQGTILFDPKREQTLVPVTIPTLGPYNGTDGQFFKTADAAQSIPHPGFLNLKFRLVGNMTVTASAALSKVRAIGFYPLQRGGEQFLQFPVGVLFGHFENFHLCPISRGGKRNKNRHPLPVTHPGALGSHAGDFHLHQVVFS